MTVECVEGCHATTPTTAAEKRCAISATTRSSSAFDRSIRMQAIKMEIVAKQISAAESFTGETADPNWISASAVSLHVTRELAKHSDWEANSKACHASRGQFSPIGPQNPDRLRRAILERSAGERDENMSPL